MDPFLSKMIAIFSNFIIQILKHEYFIFYFILLYILLGRNCSQNKTGKYNNLLVAFIADLIFGWKHIAKKGAPVLWSRPWIQTVRNVMP
jgi:hypothetical protein